MAQVKDFFELLNSQNMKLVLIFFMKMCLRGYGARKNYNTTMSHISHYIKTTYCNINTLILIDSPGVSWHMA